MFLLVDVFNKESHNDNFDCLINKRCEILRVELNKGTRIDKQSESLDVTPIYYTDHNCNKKTIGNICRSLGTISENDIPFATCEMHRGNIIQSLISSNGIPTGNTRNLKRISYDVLSRLDKGVFYFINGAYYEV